MRTVSFFLFVASLAFAQGNTGQSGTGVSRGNGLRIPQYRTTGNAAQSYFVNAATGDDTFTCRDVSTPCLTIQGAVNKIPKLLRDLVTVNVAAGSYAGFIVSGFTSDIGVQQTTGGLLIDGALVNSTLATGSATGTATGGTAGTQSTFGTLVDSGATWTVNDLVGRILTTASPTNTAFVIESNTATSITIVGTWSLPVAATTTYSIQDPSVILTSAATLAAAPTLAAVANRAAIIAADNNVNYRAGAITFRNMRVANGTGNGIELGGSAYQLVSVQVRPTSGTAFGIVNTATGALATTSLVLTRTDVFLSTSTSSGIFWSAGPMSATGLLVRGTSGGSQFGISITGGGSLGFQSSSVSGFPSGISLQNGPLVPTIANSHVYCGSAVSTFGIAIGNNLLSVVNASGNGGTVMHIDLATCGTGVAVVGGASMVEVNSITGSVGTTGLAVTQGAFLGFLKTGTTATAGTNEINIDSGGATAAFADLAAGTCLATAPLSSRVCAR